MDDVNPQDPGLESSEGTGIVVSDAIPLLTETEEARGFREGFPFPRSWWLTFVIPSLLFVEKECTGHINLPILSSFPCKERKVLRTVA
jgi:hypothetical protein